MRIGFFAWALFTNKGGIERFCAQIAHSMRHRGHECVIFHQGNEKGKPVFPLPEGVQTHNLALKNAGSLKRARQLIQDAALDVFCVMNSTDIRLWFLTICNNTGIPLIMSEHGSPQVIESFLCNRLERLVCMTAADSIHLLSQRYLSSLPRSLQERTTVIPNPAPAPVFIDWEKEKASRKRLLTVSRLSEADKRLSLLIKAFALLSEDFPDWDCYICGDGNHRGYYADLIKNLHLESRVLLVGEIENVDAHYSASHLFCLPSVAEGCPVALLEAQSHGLPSVGFASCTGVNEVIVHGENGFLAQRMTAADLAAGLRPLMESSVLRYNMGKNAQRLLSRYDEKSIFDQWEALLYQTSTAKDGTRLNFPSLTEEERATLMMREILSRDDPMETMEQARRQQRKRHDALLLRANLAIARG